MLTEEYISIAESIELEEEGQELVYTIARLANKFVDDISRHYVEPIVDKANNIRDIINVKYVSSNNDKDEFVSILAVDSTWTRPFIELVIGDVAIIVTGFVIAAPAGIGSHGIAYIGFRKGSLEDESRFSNDVELDAKISEFYTVTKKMSSYVDMVMLDGSLYFSTIPEFFNPLNAIDIIDLKRKLSGSKLASLASTALIKMLRKAQTIGIPIVGVVKRVSSKFLLPRISSAGLKDVENILVKTNDKFILSLVLRPGEYIVLESYLDTLKQYLSYIVKRFTGQKVIRAKKVLEILEACTYTENELLYELCNYMENTAIVFYRQIGDAVYPQSVRLDIYPRTFIEKVVNYAIHNTSQNAVPIPIDYIDRYIRLESSVIKRVYTMLKTYIKSPDTFIALSPTNPQKHYLFDYEQRFSAST